MELGLESFSYHLAFGRGRMDVFDFIGRTAELGLACVQINVAGGPPGWGHLGGVDPRHLRDVRSAIEARGLSVEIDTQKTDPEHLRGVLGVCHALGAGVLRTYEKPSGDLEADKDRAAANLAKIVPLCAELGVRIAFENHEYETSADVLDVIRRVDSEWVGALVDTGNSMMVWEDPVRAVKALAPHAVSSHFKDHLVIIEDGDPRVAGIALGAGSIDCAECLRVLVEESPLARVNIEVCYDYRAPFRRPKPPDFPDDHPAFAVHPPPYDPSQVAPSTHLRTREQDLLLPEWQARAVEQSVAYVKRLLRTLEQGSSRAGERRSER